MIPTSPKWKNIVYDDCHTTEKSLTKTKLGRHVYWLNKKREGTALIGVKTLEVAETALLGCSLVGIPSLLKKRKIAQIFTKLDLFTAAEKESPPIEMTIETKGDEKTFNHLNEYVIYQDFIWFRERESMQEWQPIYFDGFPERRPVKIHADGANLIVIDDQDYLHYKKIIEQKLRVFEKEASKVSPPKIARNSLKNDLGKFTIKNGFVWIRFHEDKTKWFPFHFAGWPTEKPLELVLEEQYLTIVTKENQYHEPFSDESLEEKFKGQFFPYSHHYFATEKKVNLELNWTKEWFTAPIARYFNLTANKRLKILEGVKDVFVTDRGAVAAYWQDAAGVEHPTYISVTTVYILTIDGKILYADPWLPNGFSENSYPLLKKKNIKLPQNFMAEKLCGSASLLCVFGINLESGNYEMLWRLEDFDTCGINPALPYASIDQIEKIKNKHHISPEIRVLPSQYEKLSPEELWKTISLEGIDLDKINSHSLTLFQYGQGNLAKKLRIETIDGIGFYEKSLDYESPWLYFFKDEPAIS